MAAVVKRSNWCKLLLALLMLVSLSFSPGFTSEDISNKITFIDISAVDGVVTAKLTVLTMDASIEHDKPALIEAFREAEKGNQEAAEQILEEAGLNTFIGYLGQIDSETVPLADAELNFYYTARTFDELERPVFHREPVLGCAEPGIETSEDGIAECDLKTSPEIYTGNCTEVSVVFGDSVFGTQINDETYPYAEEIVYVCDQETTALAVMRQEIKTILSSEVQNPLCFASMLLGGLLLASMFFAGRSPLSLLDITTPLLPKAKTMSYSGLRMGVGFARMTKEMGDMGGPGGMIASSSKATTAQMLRYLRSKGGYNKRMVDLILNSGANEVLKMLALRSLIAGKSERYIKGIIGLNGKALNEADFQRAYSKVLADLEKSSDADALNEYKVKAYGAKKAQKQGLHDSVLLLAQMSMLNAMQQSAFFDSTGQVPAWFKTPLGRTLGRLPFIGTHIMGGTASLFFGGRHIGRYYNSFARGAVRGIGDALTPANKKFSKQVQMAVDNARAQGRKPGFFSNWVALKDNERQLVKIFDNFEYGSALYQRMMKEARRDVLNWLVGTVIAKYGGKMDLTREEVMEIGEKTPDELMFRTFNKLAFSKIEAELRKILSDSRMNDLTKAGRLMALMDSNGIRFDRNGVTSAITMLTRIDTEDPRSPAAVGIIDPTNRYAMDCHKLMRLQSYLKQQFNVDKLTDIKSEYGAFQPGGKFFFTVGRETLSHGASDFNFGLYFRKTYREALEKSKAGESHPISIGDIANYTFLRIVNERWGIIDPLNNPGLDKKLIAVMKNAEKWLRSLADPEFLKSKPSFTALLGSLYSPSSRAGVGEDLMGVMGHGEEYGAMPGAWRMNMKAHWRIYGGPMGGVKSSVENQAFGEVNRAHNVPMAVQQLMDKDKKLRFKDASGKYMNTVVESYLYKRLKGMVEQDNPNTYFTSQVEFDRFRQLWASYKSHIGRERGIEERLVTDQMVAEFIKKPLGVEELSKSSWIRLKEGSFAPFIQEHTFKLAQADRVINAKYYIRRGGYWEEFAPEKFLKQKPFMDVVLGKDSEIRKILGDKDYTLGGGIHGVSPKVLQQYAGLMNKLGSNAASQAETESMFRKLRTLAAAEPKKAEAYAAMAGRILQEHSKTLGPLGFDLSRNGLVNLFGARLGGKVELEIMLNKYQGASTPEQKRAAAANLMNWAKEAAGAGEERHVKVALLLYNHADRTGDWKDFNSFDAVKLMPGATADLKPSNVQQYEQLTGVKGWFKNAINLTRHITDPISKKFNLGLEQFMLSTFGKQMKAEYEGSLVSEYFRETGGKFAAKLAAGEFGNPDMRTNADPRIKEFNRLMDSFTRYHAIWDETITRDPRGNSSAIGGAFIYSSFFHHGPAMGFGPGLYRRWTGAGYQQPWTTWGGFKANVRERAWGIQYIPQMFNWAVGTPFGVAYRTYVTSRWGFMSKYDRKYSDAPHVPGKPIQYRAEEIQKYDAQLAAYQTKMDNRTNMLQQTQGYTKDDAFNQANQELRDERPTPPSFELERDTLRPYSETQPRTSEGRAAMFNWFYASFDPTSTNLTRFAAIAAAAPGSVLTPLHLIRGVQSWILKGGTPGINRSDSNPYYVTPGGIRGQLIKATGPMVKRQYGGTEIMTGVVRSPEDMWAYQAGVNAVWGNANPGASYVDFSQSMHMDPRAANYLRYESRFRPYMEYDEYVDRQSKLGLVKRDADPFKLMMARNAEIRHYKFPENTLFRFLNPAAFFTYKAQAFITKRGQTLHNARELYRDATTGVSTNRGGSMYAGASNLATKLTGRIGDVMHQNLELGFRKSIRYCQSCHGPMVEGGVCNACSKKVRCSYCQHVVSPSHNHSCNHGIQRNLLNEDISGVRMPRTGGSVYTDKMGFWEIRKRVWGTLWGREP